MTEKHYPYCGGSFDRIIFDKDGSVWVPETENAKLRELVDYMTPIAWYGASEQERGRMRELGVEVGR